MVYDNVELVRETCCKCNVQFWITGEHQNRLVATKEKFHCPKGHGQSYGGKSDRQKLNEANSSLFNLRNANHKKQTEISNLKEELKKKESEMKECLKKKSKKKSSKKKSLTIVKLTKQQFEIMDIVRKREFATRNFLSTMLKKSKSTIDTHLRNLEKKKIITYEKGVAKKVKK